MDAGIRTEDGIMARRRGKMEGKDGLRAAVQRYRAAFGADALPCLAAVTDEAVPVAVALLDHAVMARRPLRRAGCDGARQGGRADERLPLVSAECASSWARMEAR
jgi:hypothetical protein